jgi:hypothetical protein
MLTDGQHRWGVVAGLRRSIGNERAGWVGCPRVKLRFTFPPELVPARFLKEAGPIVSPAGLRAIPVRLA